MGNLVIPCQNCYQQIAVNFSWYICDHCGYRICPFCISKHHGKYSNGGHKCSQCALGILRFGKV